MKKKKKSKNADPRELVARFVRAREAGKRSYQKSDEILRQLASVIEPGTKIQLTETGRSATLVDKFAQNAEKGIIWTPCAARRWDLEFSEV